MCAEHALGNGFDTPADVATRFGRWVLKGRSVFHGREANIRHLEMRAVEFHAVVAIGRYMRNKVGHVEVDISLSRFHDCGSRLCAGFVGNRAHEREGTVDSQNSLIQRSVNDLEHFQLDPSVGPKKPCYTR
jgi:hypothetical protein